MATKRATKDNIAMVISLNHVDYAVMEGTDRKDSQPEQFTYNKEEQQTDGDDKIWHITVVRLVDKYYCATLKYDVRMICRARSIPSEDEYESALQTAVDWIANRASHILATLTFDSFMTPFITPPFFDGEEPK